MAGNSDMANGNGFDPMAQYARLSERVENQGKDIVDMRSNMNSGFQAVNSSISALANELRGNSRTPWAVIWSAIGVSFAIIAALGSGQLSPIREDLASTKDAIKAVAGSMVTQAEMQWRTQRGVEDRQRMELAIAGIREEQVPRKEHDRVWLGYDKQLADIQRQLDEAKSQLSNIYNARDVIMDLRERVDRVERNKLGP